jgi:DNA-binding LytR/AlgR family response regulator
MNVLIAEDEILAAERLRDMLSECAPEAVVVSQVDTVAGAVEFFQSGKAVDLLLLDIQLADGKSFEIFEKVNINVPVIFITAYDQYAIHAFNFLSIDYLLKPIQLEDLRKGLTKYSQFSQLKGLQQREINLIKDYLAKSGKQYKERFLIKAGNKLHYKSIDEVAYFVAEGKEVYMVTRHENRKYLIDHTLEELATVLNPVKFFRISRKFIVCVDTIKEIRGQVSTKLEVVLNQQCEDTLSVSRDRALDFKNWLDR